MPLATSELIAIAQARLDDARILIQAGRYDGALYLCGYAVELSLKARICRTLDWLGYPATKREFDGYQSFKTHDLDILLRLSGRESYVKMNHLADWSAVAQWSPEARYQPVGTISPADAQTMITAAAALLSTL